MSQETMKKTITELSAPDLLSNPNVLQLSVKNKLVLQDIEVKLSDSLLETIKERIADGVEILGYYKDSEIITTVYIYDEVTQRIITTLTTTGNNPHITINNDTKKLIVSSTQSSGTIWDFSNTDYKSIFLENEYYNLDTWQQILLTVGSSVNLWVSKDAAAVTTVDFVDSAENPAPDKYEITSITTTQTNPVLECVGLADGTIRAELSSTSVSPSHEYHCDMTNNKYHITVNNQDYELPTNEPIQLQTGNTYKCYVSPKEIEFILTSTNNQTHTLREDFTLNGIHNLNSDVTEILKDSEEHTLTISSHGTEDTLTIYGTYRQ